MYKFLFLILCSNFCYSQIWHDQSIDKDVYLHSIVFSDSSTGWIAGDSGYVLKTADAGDTWNKLESFPFPENLLDVQAVDPSAVYFLSGATSSGSYFILSSDSGNTWEVSRFFLSNVFITDFHFVNRDTGYAVALNGRMFKTYDRAQNWEELDDPSNAFPNKKVAFINDTVGFVTGGRFDILGFIKKTTDAGVTWRNTAVTIEPINNLFFINEDTIFAVSGDPDLGGWIYRSDDKGENWTLLDTLGGFFLLQGIDISNRNLGWVSGAATILNTTDFGESWNIVREDSQFIASIASNNKRDFWFVGSNGYIFKYEDTTGTVSNVIEDKNIEESFTVSVYPNPFNSSAKIHYSLLNKTLISISLFNVLGEQIKHLYEGLKDPGNHVFDLEMSSFPSGVYLLVFNYNGSSKALKVNLIK